MAKYYLSSNVQDKYPLQYVLIALEDSITFLTRNKDKMGVDASANLPSETIRMAMVMVSVLPIACAYPFFQTTVPDAIIESAKIDGARMIRIFVQIVLPISLPAIATIGLFLTFAYWNDWMMAKYYISGNKHDLFPLQYVLISLEENLSFLTRNSQNMTAGTATNIPSETVRMAMVVVSVVPIALSYPFFQKYFVSGLTIGAVKG
jgi:putative aldouronate transport system permease protein